MKDLNNKVAVITGAGSGIGREIALLCAKHNMKLVLADINLQAAEETARLSASTQTLCCEVDVSSAEAVQALAEKTCQIFNTVDILFNNAGIFSTGLCWETSAEDWKNVLGINLMGVVHGIQAFVPRMLQQGSPAHILNTASLAGLSSVPGAGAYCASKHAVVALSECLHHELSQEAADVTVSVLCPGFVPTGIVDTEHYRDTSPYAKQMRQAVEAGRLDAKAIAQCAIDGIQAGDFYILPHAAARKSVAMRAEDIIEGKQPRDPAGGAFSHTL